MEDVRTPLEPVLSEVGAKFTSFAGWHMPLRFSSDKEEHTVVREACGLFDLSHMAQIDIEGPDAATVLDASLCTAPSRMDIGRAKYSLILDQDGGIIDDLIVYRLAESTFLVVANAANRETVVGELTARSRAALPEARVSITDETLNRALIAIQGPNSVETVCALFGPDNDEAIRALRYYRIAELDLDGVKVRLARTGYTGEIGYEIMMPATLADTAYRRALEVGAPYGLRPCGLAARDTLRLEAGMCLYGHELDRTVSPKDVGLAPLIGKHTFVGASALRDRPQEWELVGLAGEGKRAARAGSDISFNGESIGTVTSGVLSPTLGHPIALARVKPGLTEGDTVIANIRGTDLPMTVVKLPFYSRTRA
ncbi:glycine cleavage system aminomethyltransferase GcvT [Arcanobacterium haemolyticum]|nr:glycine cleavage system aminomethyltransferase GcvT [Arcanobacterium haemolyticum]